MKRYLATLAAVVGATVLSACGPAAPPMNDPADIAAIGQVRSAFIKGYNTGDATLIASLYAADGQGQANHQPTAKGHDAILAANKANFDAMTASLEVVADATMSNGTYGMDRGHFKLTLTPKGGGPAITDEGRYVVLLMKGADGAWKVTMDIDNSSLPMPAPPPMPMKGKGGK
jgi:uncharacterized protein (TIGR02246 family)